MVEEVKIKTDYSLSINVSSALENSFLFVFRDSVSQWNSPSWN